ncbi:hypothetical protein KAU43_06885, partial [candidate division WOR-3 bacterium]|nr:hypothetical protein [candidate division WOR-3 bacterium]
RIYYKINNGSWKVIYNYGSGYKKIQLGKICPSDTYKAFSFQLSGNTFYHYSNISSVYYYEGGGVPKLFSNSGNKYILEYELFTPDRTDNAILLKNNALIGNNFKFRIINSDKNTYIDNIKLYVVDSKKDISLKDTKDEISTTNGKDIKTELEQESFDSKLSSIDNKYYILNPNDTLDFIFKNIDRKLSEGYTRNYVMEITGYQADDTIDFISGIADKRKKIIKNDVRTIRSVGSSLKIEFSSIQDREINLKVCDLSGRILRNEKIDLSKGRKNYLIESLPQGVYLIKADNKSFKGIILK